LEGFIPGRSTCGSAVFRPAFPQIIETAQDEFAMTTTVARKAAAALTLAAIAAVPFGAAAPAATQASPPATCEGKDKWPGGIWLNVVAENVISSQGYINVTVYGDNRGKFLAKGGSLMSRFFPAQKGETRACVMLPKSGVYAIALYHDANGNKTFDRKLLPDEGYGFSNNPSTLAGLPAWSSVRLNVPKPNLVTHIDLKYP
jgi:uncharacterized protein (DUF2141 family)